MGPFKYEVDDGIENRKLALESLYALLDLAPEALNHQEFFDHLKPLLKDQHDLRQLSYLVLIRFAQKAPGITQQSMHLF